MNLINNLWDGHCFGSSRARCTTGGKITTFKVGYPVFDGGIRWCMFPFALQGGKKHDDSSGLHVVEIARVAWHASFQHLWQEETWNSAHEQISVSNDIIDSVLRHREVGRAKDLSAPPRICVYIYNVDIMIQPWPHREHSIFYKNQTFNSA